MIVFLSIIYSYTYMNICIYIYIGIYCVNTTKLNNWQLYLQCTLILVLWSENPLIPCDMYFKLKTKILVFIF